MSTEQVNTIGKLVGADVEQRLITVELPGSADISGATMGAPVRVVYIRDVVQAANTGHIAQQAKVKICPWCAGRGRRYYSDVEPDAVCHTCGGTGKLSTVG